MTSAMIQVNAKSRTGTGTSEAGRIRAKGEVPAVAYGHDLPSTLLTVDPKQIVSILGNERGKNNVLKVDVEGKKNFLAMIKEYAYHPVKRNLTHVDFVEVKLDKPVDVEIPLFTKGKAVGVTAGGMLRQVYRMVPVRCVPDRIPLKIEVDVTELKLGEAIATKDLKLGDGVSARLPEEQTLVAVVAPEKDRTEEEAAAAAPGAAAAGAAPAAGAAAPAAGAKGAAAPAAGAAAPAAAKDAKKK